MAVLCTGPVAQIYLRKDTHSRDNERGTLARNSMTAFLDTERVTQVHLSTETYFRDNEMGSSTRNFAPAFLDVVCVLLWSSYTTACVFVRGGLVVPFCVVGLAIFGI